MGRQRKSIIIESLSNPLQDWGLDGLQSNLTSLFYLGWSKEILNLRLCVGSLLICGGWYSRCKTTSFRRHNEHPWTQHRTLSLQGCPLRRSIDASTAFRISFAFVRKNLSFIAVFGLEEANIFRRRDWLNSIYKNIPIIASSCVACWTALTLLASWPGIKQLAPPRTY
jgi:hypothetical protein